MAYFPLFVNLEGRRVLVVGGGKIAGRRDRVCGRGTKIRKGDPGELSDHLEKEKV